MARRIDGLLVIAHQTMIQLKGACIHFRQTIENPS